jgi:ATP-dependent Clp protease adaptor protein ClpS
MNEEKTTGVLEPEIEDETTVGLPFKVVVFNDDWHAFDEVIAQLMKAVKCSFENARNYAFEIHVKGKAVVFMGQLQECLRVTSILEEIALHTQVIS